MMANLRGLSTSEDPNTPNLEELLQIAMSTLKQGNKQGAEVIVRQVLEADKYNDRAWVLLAFTTEDETQRRRWLNQALRLNPKNNAATRALEKLDRKRTNVKDRTIFIGTMGLVAALGIAVVACVLVLVLN
jgi:type II secretory pathway component HofQ